MGRGAAGAVDVGGGCWLFVVGYWLFVDWLFVDWLLVIG